MRKGNRSIERTHRKATAPIAPAKDTAQWRTTAVARATPAPIVVRWRMNDGTPDYDSITWLSICIIAASPIILLIGVIYGWITG